MATLRGPWGPNGWGTQSTETALPDTLEAGDPQYNERQQQFESGVDWNWVTQDLQQKAKEAGVAFDPSDVEGIKRNAGYDQAHLGDAGLYNDNLDKFYNNALENYQQRAHNKDGGHSNDDGTMMATGGRASGGSSSTGDWSWLNDVLKGIGTNGAFNQDIVNRRADNARDVLNANKRSTIATNQAALASRGLIGDGPERTARNAVDLRANEAFNQAYNDIFADESRQADSRMTDALRTAASLSQSKDNLDLGYYNADIQKMLGQGNLALGNLNAMNNYNLGLGDLELGQWLGQAGIDQKTIDQILQANSQGVSLAELAAAGKAR